MSRANTRPGTCEAFLLLHRWSCFGQNLQSGSAKRHLFWALNPLLLILLPQIGCEPPEQTTGLTVAELARRTLRRFTGRLLGLIKDGNKVAEVAGAEAFLHMSPTAAALC